MAVAAGARIAPGMGFVRRSPHHFAMRTSPGPSREAAATVSKPWLATAVGILVLLRIPSFLEPHWYSDESTYSYVGRTIFRGGDLYTSIGAWDNKPPLQYWTYGILTHFLGYSEAAIHLIPFLSALAAVAAIGWGVARLTGSPRRAGIACVLAALTLGSPLFDAQLFLPEGALIGPMTWAGMLLLVFITSPEWAARHRWAPYVAGALASIALGLQQTVIADVVALSVILLIAVPGRWRDLLPLLGDGTRGERAVVPPDGDRIGLEREPLRHRRVLHHVRQQGPAVHGDRAGAPLRGHRRWPHGARGGRRDRRATGSQSLVDALAARRCRPSRGRLDALHLSASPGPGDPVARRRDRLDPVASGEPPRRGFTARASIGGRRDDGRSHPRVRRGVVRGLVLDQLQQPQPEHVLHRRLRRSCQQR